MRTIKLCQGKGKLGESHCVMAATSIVAEESFSDEPKCVDDIITTILIHINDSLSDNVRDELLSHLPWVIIGTRDTRDVTSAAKTRTKRRLLLYKYMQENYGYKGSAVVDTVIRFFIEQHNEISDEEIKALEFLQNKLKGGKEWTRYIELVKKSKRILDKHKNKVKHLVDFIENKLVPVYTTMPIEPAYNIDKLVCH